MDTPLPGQDHPAIAHMREFILSNRDNHRVEIALQPDLSYVKLQAEPDAVVESRRLWFERRYAVASLLPEYGHYVWFIWTDQYGRSVTSDAWWSPHPDVHLLPEWNPS